MRVKTDSVTFWNHQNHHYHIIEVGKTAGQTKGRDPGSGISGILISKKKKKKRMDMTVGKRPCLDTHYFLKTSIKMEVAQFVYKNLH